MSPAPEGTEGERIGKDNVGYNASEENDNPPVTNVVTKNSDVKPSKALDVSRENAFENEGVRSICYQTFFPFLIGGLGSTLSGLLLNHVQKLPLLCRVPELLAVCPPLQGMKGNLDMTFTSRLGTMAHQGRLQGDGYFEGILRSMCLIQAQAVFISLFATLITFVLETLRVGIGHHPPTTNFLFLGSNAVMAMCIACGISSSAMVVLVLVVYRKSLNPDNIATPFAATIGDLLTIGMMASIAIAYYPFASISIAVPLTVIGTFLTLTPLGFFIAYKDEQAWIAAREQLPTLLLAAVLSSGAGIVQAFGATKFPELTAYQPLIAGNSGNRASLQSARISSYLHTYKGANRLQRRLNPWAYYTSADHESRAALFLVASAPAFQLLFVLISHLVANITLNPLKLNGVFLIGYLCTAFIQAVFLVYTAEVVVYSLFLYGFDPDMHAIPLITSIGDLVGTSLLLLLFNLMSLLKDTVVVSLLPLDSLTNTTTSCTYGTTIL